MRRLSLAMSGICGCIFFLLWSVAVLASYYTYNFDYYFNKAAVFLKFFELLA